MSGERPAPRTVITVVGEALVDLLAERGTHTLTSSPGGSPLNVAVGLGRLDVPTSLFARLSGDRFGRMLRAHLLTNEVSGRDLIAAPEPSTLAVASLDEAGSASYDFWVSGTAAAGWHPTDLPDQLAEDVAILHTGSLASWLPPSAEQVEALLGRERHRNHVTVSLDPNCRPLLIPNRADAARAIERQVALAHVVKVSEEDVAWLMDGESAEHVARRWHEELGPALVIVTRGRAGALAVTSSCVVHVAGILGPVADTVGASDAFTSGLLAGLHDWGLHGPGFNRRVADLDGGALSALIEQANMVAALTCRRRGADPPSRKELSGHLRLIRPLRISADQTP